MLVGVGALLLGNLFFSVSETAVVPLVIRSFIFLLMVCSLPGNTVYNRLTRFAVLFLVVGCLESMAGSLMELFLLCENSYEKRIAESSVVLFFLFLAECLEKYFLRQKDRELTKLVKKGMLPIVILLAAGATAATALLKYSVSYVPKTGVRDIAIVLDLFTNLGVGILGLLLFFVERSNKKMEQMLDMEQHMRKMQIDYYEQILEREKATRKYRHDMSNHLLCLNEYAKNGDLRTLEQYIHTLQNEMDRIHKRIYQTGNQVLDILINYYTSILPDGVKVQVEGLLTINPEERIMCTVFGNLLQNAAEELICSKEDAYLRIYLKQGDKYAKVTIENSKVNRDRNVNKKNRNREGEEFNHYGFGIQNAREALYGLSAKLVLSENTDKFTAEVIFHCVDECSQC